MADKLAIYREALRHLGVNARLTGLTEVRSERYALDDAWEPAVEYLLAKGLWNFAMRSVELSADEDAEPLFGYSYAFSKPDDWVRTASISDQGADMDGFEDYSDEPGYWYANVDTLYVSYVSNDDEYGWNVASWRQPFAKALAAYLAFDCGLPVAADRGTRKDMFQIYTRLLKEAKTLDAVDERVRREPPGRLVRARMISNNRKDG